MKQLGDNCDIYLLVCSRHSGYQHSPGRRGVDGIEGYAIHDTELQELPVDSCLLLLAEFPFSHLPHILLPPFVFFYRGTAKPSEGGCRPFASCGLDSRYHMVRCSPSLCWRDLLAVLEDMVLHLVSTRVHGVSAVKTFDFGNLSIPAYLQTCKD